MRLHRLVDRSSYVKPLRQSRASPSRSAHPPFRQVGVYPPDVSPEELEVWTKYQLVDLADDEGAEDVPSEPLPSNSHATLRGLGDWDA